LRSLLPNLKGLRVLDLGCGFGWVCRWARSEGAIAVHGFDLSENMLSQARTYPNDAAITYSRADLETLELPVGAYDVAFSSLTLHYLEALPKLVAQVFQSLAPGGSFVFSAEHPIFTAPRNPKWIKDDQDHSIWPLDGYLYEGPRTTDWLAKGVVKQHRTVGGYISILLGAGFVLTALEEWGPTEEQIKEKPQWANERQRPSFLLVAAKKPHTT
jgi:SAM-dependent methyltransferase